MTVHVIDLDVQATMTVVNGVRLLSNSEVQTFKDCSRKWWLAWHRGLKPKRRSVIGPRSTGQREHAALAALYTPGGAPQDAWRVLSEVHTEDEQRLNEYVAALEFGENPGGGADELRRKLASDYDLERAMLEGYLEWLVETGVDSQLEVISAEQRVEVPFTTLNGQQINLIAKIDARVRNLLTGGLKFIDHKTVGSLLDPVLGLNQQMLHYHIIEDLLTQPGQPRCEGALYNMLRKVKRTRASKPPYFGRTPIDHNRHELSAYGLQLLGVIDKIVQAEQLLKSAVPHQRAVPARPSRDCSWKCDFFKICRMFDDGSRVEAAIEDHYVAGDPLAYYDDRETNDADS